MPLQRRLPTRTPRLHGCGASADRAALARQRPCTCRRRCVHVTHLQSCCVRITLALVLGATLKGSDAQAESTQMCAAAAKQSRGLTAGHGGSSHPFEVPRKIAASGSSLWTITLLRASVVPSLHRFSRCRAARGALSSNTSITRRPAHDRVLSM